MPVSSFTCPRCNGVVQSAGPIPEGRRVTCGNCGGEFSAGEALAAPPVAAAPQSTRPPSVAEARPANGQSPSPPTQPGPLPGSVARSIANHWVLILILGLAGSGLLLVCVCAGAVLAVYKTTKAITQPSSLDDPRAALYDIEAEMTLAELEARLGPARKVSFEELPLADRPTPGKQDRAELEQLSRKYRIRTWYLWTGTNRWVFAGFRTGRSSIVARYEKKPNGDEGMMLHDSENTLP